MKSLAGMNLKEIESVVLSLGEKAYRAKQILEAVNNGVDSIDKIHTRKALHIYSLCLIYADPCRMAIYVFLLIDGNI